MNLYVQNIPYQSTENELYKFFSSYGNVVRVSVPLEHESGRPRGFAFVEMENQVMGEKAIREADRTVFDGRVIKVSEANPMRKSPGQF